MGGLDRILCLEDFEARARRRLPRSVYGYISGGVEDEWSLGDNRKAFGDFGFRPRMLVDTSGRSIRTELFGETWQAPFGIAPMGGSGLAWFGGDVTLARAAATAGIPSVLSGASLTPLERIAEANPRAWFQAYMPTDRDGMAALAERAARAGYGTLVVTVDVPVSANRENNVRNGYSTPLRPTVRLAWDSLMHPRWMIGTLARTFWTGGMPHFENFRAERNVPLITSKLDRPNVRDSFDWDDVAFIRDKWKGRLLIKGIMCPGDVAPAQKLGIDGIGVSNHGGRQLDGTVSPLRVLPEIAAEAGGMAVLYDGGIRRGTDVLKALALGADFVLVGRPFLFAMASAGRAGVLHAVKLLRDEIERDVALLGCTDFSDLAQRLVPVAPAPLPERPKRGARKNSN